MDETIGLVKDLFSIAPYPAAFIALGFMYFKQNGIKKANGTKYVHRDECHIHIDSLRDEIREIHDDMKYLHEKVNETNTAVARIEGKLDR